MKRNNDMKKSLRDKIALDIVELSCKDVLEEFELKHVDILVKPEIVHTVGKLVATHAISMVKDCTAAGMLDDAGCDASDIIDTIGRIGFELELSPYGELSPKVNMIIPPGIFNQPIEKVAACAADIEDEPVKGDDKSKVEVGHKAVIKAKDGTTTIIIEKLNVYITANLVEEMYVNPERVYHQLNGELKEITGAIIEKSADEEKVENQDEETR